MGQVKMYHPKEVGNLLHNLKVAGSYPEVRAR